MILVRYANPAPQLHRFVRRYVERRTPANAAVTTEPVVARLGVMLEFQFAARYEIPVYATGFLEPCPLVTLVGPMTYRRVRLHIPANLDALVVLFSPQGFHDLFGEPIAPLTEAGTEAHSVLGKRIPRWYQQLGNATTFEQRVALLDEFLLERLHEVKVQDPLGRAFDCLAGPGSSVRIGQMFAQTGLSLRQFERKCLERTGVTPKVMARIARFQKALQMKQARGQSWAQIAHSLDYHDQMHMIRDFRAFAGVTPVQACEEIAADHLFSLMDAGGLIEIS
jgi:AraC-like DNA-binding protein